MKRMSKLLQLLLVSAFGLAALSANAELISANGRAEVSIKANKGDVISARRIAKNAAEVDAIVAAIKLKLNVNPNDAKAKAAIEDMVKQLVDNIKTTFITEGDILTAKSSLEVDGTQLYDLARSLGLGSSAQVAAAKVLFIIDEYSGIATSIDPSQPIETEMEYSHDKSAFSDKSSAGASSEANSESNSQSSQSATAYSSKEKSAVSAKESVAVNAKESVAVNSKGSSAASAKDGSRSASAASSSQASGKASAEYSGAASSKYAAASSSQKSGAASSKNSSASASASSSSSSFDTKDIQEQKDIVNLKVKTKFPDLNNAKPSEGADELITARLEEVSKKFGLQLASEMDFRVEGGRKLLIKDIEKLSKFSYYQQKASKPPFSAKYIVYGTAVMNSEGKTASGDVQCTGQLKVQSANVDSGQSLVSETMVKRAVGSSDQSCKANLSTALATSLAEKIGVNAQKEIQITATQGSSFDVALFSVLKVPAKVRRNFTEKLQKLSDEVVEGNATETIRSFVVQAKGNFKTKIEDLVEDMKEEFPEMKDARMEAKGNQLTICIEGKCP